MQSLPERIRALFRELVERHVPDDHPDKAEAMDVLAQPVVTVDEPSREAELARQAEVATEPAASVSVSQERRVAAEGESEAPAAENVPGTVAE